MALANIGEGPSETGWWPDPWDPTRRRYWNGTSWGKEVKTAAEADEIMRIKRAAKRSEEIKNAPGRVAAKEAAEARKVAPGKAKNPWGPNKKTTAKRPAPAAEPEPEVTPMLDAPEATGPHGEKPMFKSGPAKKKKSPPNQTKKAPPVAEPVPEPAAGVEEKKETPAPRPGGGFRAARKKQPVEPPVTGSSAKAPEDEAPKASRPGGGFRAARKTAATTEPPAANAFKPKKRVPPTDTPVKAPVEDPDGIDHEDERVKPTSRYADDTITDAAEDDSTEQTPEEEREDERIREAEAAFAAINGGGKKGKVKKEKTSSGGGKGKLSIPGNLSVPKMSIPDFKGKSLFAGMSPVSLIVAAVFVLIILIGPFFATNADTAEHAAAKKNDKETSQSAEGASSGESAEDPSKVIIGNRDCAPLRKSIQEYVANGRSETITPTMRNNLAGALSSKSVTDKRLKATILKANEEDNFKLIAASCNLS